MSKFKQLFGLLFLTKWIEGNSTTIKEDLKVITLDNNNDINYLNLSDISGDSEESQNIQDVLDIGNTSITPIVMNGFGAYFSVVQGARTNNLNNFGVFLVDTNINGGSLVVSRQSITNNNGSFSCGLLYPEPNGATISRYIPIEINGKVADINGKVSLSQISGTFANPTSITVVNGVITAIS